MKEYFNAVVILMEQDLNNLGDLLFYQGYVKGLAAVGYLSDEEQGEIAKILNNKLREFLG